MNTILNIVTIAMLILVFVGLVAIYVYQKRTRAIFRTSYANQMKHVWATAALHKSIIDTPFPLPGSNGWSLSSELLAYLVRKILRDKTKLVVELGSGLSTIVLGQALKRVGGQLISVEADIKYLGETEAMIHDADLGDYISLIHAPLEKYDEHHIWYSKSALENLASIDMLIVDGPPRATCHLARYPALPFFLSGLKPNAVIILDDAKRSDEQEIIDRWKRYPAIKDILMLPFPHTPTALQIEK